MGRLFSNNATKIINIIQESVVKTTQKKLIDTVQILNHIRLVVEVLGHVKKMIILDILDLLTHSYGFFY